MINNKASLRRDKATFADMISLDKIGNYILPMLKQVFKDSFTGSEVELGIILFFTRSYLLIAVDFIASAICDTVLRRSVKARWL